MFGWKQLSKRKISTISLTGKWNFVQNFYMRIIYPCFPTIVLYLSLLLYLIEETSKNANSDKLKLLCMASSPFLANKYTKQILLMHIHISIQQKLKFVQYSFVTSGDRNLLWRANVWYSRYFATNLSGSRLEIIEALMFLPI